MRIQANRDEVIEVIWCNRGHCVMPIHTRHHGVGSTVFLALAAVIVILRPSGHQCYTII